MSHPRVNVKYTKTIVSLHTCLQLMMELELVGYIFDCVA